MHLRQADFDGLTEKQAKLLRLLLQGVPVGEASLLAGYSHDTAGYQALASPIFLNAMHTARDRIIRTEGANLGLRTLMELARDTKTPATVRRQAAKDLVGLAGHVAPSSSDGIGEKKLAEMSEEELREFVDQAQQRLAEGAKPAAAAVNAQPGHIDRQPAAE